MSKEVTVILVIFGGLFGLLVVAIVALVVMIPNMGKLSKSFGDPSDPKSNARIAAKIAKFTVPPGYVLRDGMDMGLEQSVVVEPIDPAMRGFQIQLTGKKLPSDRSVEKNAGETAFGLVGKMLSGCEMAQLPDDVVDVRGKSVHLSVRGCSKGTNGMRTEYGFFEATDPDVSVLAAGLEGHFDENALHELLNSVR